MVGIGTKGLCCSEELDPKGEWIWTVGVTGHGINASSITVGNLNASLMKIGVLKSFNDKSWINMHDGTFNFQDKLKFVDGKFSIDLSGEDLVGQDDLDGLSAKIDITARDIRMEMTNVDKNLQSSINVNAEVITQKVSNVDFNSYKSQTANSISQKVSSGQGFSSEFNQNAQGFNFSLGNGNTNVNINKDAMVIKNGKFQMLNNAGEVSIQGDTNGNFEITKECRAKDRFRTENDFIMTSPTRYSWVLHRPANTSERGFVLARRHNYGQEDWYLDAGFVFKPDVGGYNQPSIQFGQKDGIWLKGIMNDPQLQARNFDDSGYVRVVGSAFVNGSSNKLKDNISETDVDQSIDILTNNYIKQYSYNTEMQRLETIDKEALSKDIELEIETITADKKIGLVLEELTEQAKDILNPTGTDGIDIYAMCSLLWNVCQKQQTTITEQENRLKRIEDLLFATSK